MLDSKRKIYTFSVDSLQFHYCFFDGIFALSTNTLMLEEASRQIDSDVSILDYEGFQKVSNTEGKYTDANFYVNLNKFPKLLSNYFDPKFKKTIKNFSNVGGWMELDLNLKSDGFLLNGFTSTGNKKSDYLNVFIKQEPQKMQMHNCLPKNTPAFVCLGISNFPLFRNHYKEYLRNSGSSKSIQKLTSVNKKYDIDLEASFATFFNKDAVLALSSKLNKSGNYSYYCMLGTKSASIALEKLAQINKKVLQNKAARITDNAEVYKIDSDSKYYIYKFPITNYCSLLFGELFENVRSDYFCIIDNYLVFSENINVLRLLIKENVTKNTLKNDVNYNDFNDYLSSKSNFLFYANIPKSNTIIQSLLDDKYHNNIQNSFSAINKFHALGMQFLSNGEMIYNNLYLQYKPLKTHKTNAFWESKIDTVFNYKPAIVLNHNTQEKELIIQDLKNNLYLVNTSGRILWKLPVSNKIISEVHQVDYYKNGKLQFLFNTNEYLYLIDRNGNSVENYPIKLASKATSGLAVFDYEKDKNYRIFIPNNNKNVVCYNIKGNVVSGWEFNKTESYVRTKPQFFRIQNKDYIVFADSFKIYMLNRKGIVRTPIKQSFSKSSNNIFHLEKKGNYRLVTTDINGKVKYVYFNGQVDTYQFKEYSDKHFFDYKDVDGDGNKDYIIIDNNNLEVYSSTYDEIFAYSFENTIVDAPVYFRFPGNISKLGITDQVSNEIFLFNDDGSVYRDFPLQGNTRFTISKAFKNSNSLYLFVGDQNGFLINYQIN